MIGKKFFKKKIEIIAEIANAHQGDYKKALKIAEKACQANADSIKFQIYFADELLTKNHTRYGHFKKQSFSKKQWEYICKNIRKKFPKIKIYCDVLGLKSLELSKKLGLDGIKIHSSDVGNNKLIEKLIGYKKKIFVSCGGVKLFEIINLISKFKLKKNLVLLHGFQSYPTKIEDVNFEKLKYLMNLFGQNLDYGYQDHTSGASKYNLYTCILALGIGVTFIEKHITIDRKKKGIDYFSSIEPKQFKEFVKIIKKCEKSFGQDSYHLSKNEVNYRSQVRKFWVANKILHKNKILTYKDIDILRANTKVINPINIENYINRKILYKIKKNEVLLKNSFKNKVCAVIVARLNSKRLNNKSLLPIGDSNVLDHLFKRVKKIKTFNKIIFCTTTNKIDQKLIKIAKKNNISYFTGSELNVLGRMMQPLKKINPDIVVRITGDDIFIDENYANIAISYFLKNNLDYVDHKRLPGGTEIEIFDYQILKFLYEKSADLNGTEYLSNYIKDNKDLFNIGSAPVKTKHASKTSMSIDNQQDYLYGKKFLQNFYKNNKNYYNYSLDDIVAYIKKNKKKNIKEKKNLIKVNTMINLN